MTDSAPATSAPANTEPSMQQKLVDVKLDSQNAALNVIIGFITLGQQRGVCIVSKNRRKYGNAFACFNNHKLLQMK